MKKHLFAWFTVLMLGVLSGAGQSDDCDAFGFSCANAQTAPGGPGGGSPGGPGGGGGGGGTSEQDLQCPETDFTQSITNMCWECIFPISIGPIPIGGGGTNYPDTANPNFFICFCPVAWWWRTGLAVGFWQPGHLVDVTRIPGCMLSLGGMKMDTGGGVTGEHTQTTADDRETSFFNLHWIRNYWMEWLIDEIDDQCLEESEETTYLSELDSTWENPEMDTMFAPEAALFTSIIANAACAADCIWATVNLPFDSMVWCQGCYGTTYPLGGWVGYHVGGAQSGALLAQRAGAKLSRMFMLRAVHAHAWIDYCGQHNDFFINKSQYRHQLLYPIAQTSDNSLGGCCQPFGRSALLWGLAKEYPYEGEDFTYLIWEKRHCCMD